MYRHKLLGLFTVSMGMSAAIFAPSLADAAWRRVSGLSCEPPANSTAIYKLASGLQNNSTGWVDFVCPIQEDSDFKKESVSVLNIHGEDRHNSQYVITKACFTYFDSTGGECGDPAMSGTGTGQYQLSPSRAKWQLITSHFPYVLVVLPQYHSTLGASTVRGVWWAIP